MTTGPLSDYPQACRFLKESCFVEGKVYFHPYGKHTKNVCLMRDFSFFLVSVSFTNFSLWGVVTGKAPPFHRSVLSDSSCVTIPTPKTERGFERGGHLLCFHNTDRKKKKILSFKRPLAFQQPRHFAHGHCHACLSGFGERIETLLSAPVPTETGVTSNKPLFNTRGRVRTRIRGNYRLKTQASSGPRLALPVDHRTRGLGRELEPLAG